MSLRSLRRGFTLIELLLVIGIIAILAAIVIVAINPTKQLGDARNAQRRADVNTILNAVYQYSIDNNGNMPSTITNVVTPICKSGVDVVCGGNVNLNVLTGAYLVAIPNDPQADVNGVSADYTIVKDTTTKRITVAAPNAEQGASISVTR
jgi:type IV pilus assembly protein PilA